MTPQALSDLKILEFGDFISAPYCGKLFADLGAEVIKVERPRLGDPARHHGPFLGDEPHPERSGLFLYLNTDKLGITLDPTAPSGRALFYELVKWADILVENHLPREMAAWQLDYATLRAINPRLIMTSVTGFGQTGPYRDYKAHDINIQAGAGIAYRIGDPAREPLAAPEYHGDYWGAINAAPATLMAVFARERTGAGQHVDISAVECLSTLVNVLNMMDVVDVGFYPTRGGTRIRYIWYPWTILPCKDGFFSMITIQERHWLRFVELMGNPEWAQDPRYQDRDAMGKLYPEEVDARVIPWLMEHTKAELWEMCRANKIPFHAVHDTADVVNSPHLKAREYFVSVDHPATGPLTYPGAPYKLSRTPWRIRRPAPLLGEHNRAIYCGRLGLSESELVELYRGGVI